MSTITPIKSAAAREGSYTLPRQERAEPMGWGWSQAPQGVKQLPCHLLMSVMSRRGTTKHLPCPACLVNTSQMRSLISTLNKGDRQAQPKGVFWNQESVSDHCSRTDPRVNEKAQSLQLQVLFPLPVQLDYQTK